jgi:hypothetical protein
MMSRPLITELPACGPSGGGNYPKTLRGPVGKERPAGPRSHIRDRNALNRVVRRSSLVNRSEGVRRCHEESGHGIDAWCWAC